jgi:aspartyl-tRNA(Asn)/glutamyl-tRNA(Gln) amidotransferase subunit C
MQIDDKLISYLEDLSYLTLPAGEKSRLAEDLGKILNSIEKLRELNTDGVQECSHPFGNFNVFRDDEVRPSFDRELILKNAPVRNDEFFVAPKTVE